ncbi:hypothetical protein PHYPO_G00166790 [Pangasianodon hypophthalmus]|uniref:Uncharacterized protein n=1 Tax=Pangasianodon hypophthalmus TaxID=310915 RepID=A0A5N5JMN9_PANHP|nr:hypothetical protein PHYPO_G00166790 [Pangasianodon hypophthalmus]
MAYVSEMKVLVSEMKVLVSEMKEFPVPKRAARCHQVCVQQLTFHPESQLRLKYTLGPSKRARRLAFISLSDVFPMPGVCRPQTDS